jgi:hypothetical protein
LRCPYAADPVLVEPAQREALEALVRAHSTSQQLALRARLILQAADDVGVRESAKSDALRTLNPNQAGQRSDDCGQLVKAY